MPEPGPVSDFAVLRIACDQVQLPSTESGDLFAPFFRVSEGRVVDTGLGLAIAKEIIELHGGQISARRNDTGEHSFVIRLVRINRPLHFMPG